jgi:adenylate kinase
MKDTATDTRSVNLILLGPPGAGKGHAGADADGPLRPGAAVDRRSPARRGCRRDRGGSCRQGGDGEGRACLRRDRSRRPEGRLDQPDVAAGTILDGFPRTAAQAEALDTLLADRGQQIDAVISLEVDDEAMVERVSGRYTCASCGEGYHDSFKQPARDGVCDTCGGTQMKRRADDNAETVRTRLSAYHADTAPLVDYYAARGTLTAIPAMGEIGEIAEAMNAIVSPLATA